jgi:tetratricopeptide (TPR) repeat protein
MPMRALIAAALIAATSGAPAALAAADAGAQTAPSASVLVNPEKPVRLNRLFAALHAAPTVEEGQAVEQDILAEWLRSGDVEVDKLMATAIQQMNTGLLGIALGTLDTVVAMRPDYVEGWNKRATLYFYLDEYDKSLADIASTLQLEPRHFGALAGLGMIMVKLGDRQRALQAFERAYAADPALDNIRQTIDALKTAGGKDI